MFNNLIDFVKIRTLLVESFLQSLSNAASVCAGRISEADSNEGPEKDATHFPLAAEFRLHEREILGRLLVWEDNIAHFLVALRLLRGVV